MLTIDHDMLRLARKFRRRWPPGWGGLQFNACPDCCPSPSPSPYPSSVGSPTYKCVCGGNTITLPQALTATLHSSGCSGLDGQTLSISTAVTSLSNEGTVLAIRNRCLGYSAAPGDTFWAGEATLCSFMHTQIIFGCETQTNFNACGTPSPSFKTFWLFLDIDSDANHNLCSGGTGNSCEFEFGCACSLSTCNPFILQFGKSASCTVASPGNPFFISDVPGAGGCSPCCNNSGGPFANTDDLLVTISE